MKSSIVVFLFLALSALPSLAVAAVPADSAVKEPSLGPPRYTVHEDHVAPGKFDEFVQVRRDWFGVMKAKHLNDERGAFIEVDGNTFISIHPFEAYGGIDSIRALRRKAVKAAGSAANKAYDHSDALLIPPHKSEIWSREGGMEYHPAGPETEKLTETHFGAGTLTIELLNPTGEAAYSYAWDTVLQALSQAKYPLTQIVFYSAYGTGETKRFWVAKSQAEFDKAPKPTEAVATILGEQRSRDLFARIQACLAHTETHRVVLRTDLYE